MEQTKEEKLVKRLGFIILGLFLLLIDFSLFNFYVSEGINAGVGGIQTFYSFIILANFILLTGGGLIFIAIGFGKEKK